MNFGREKGLVKFLIKIDAEYGYVLVQTCSAASEGPLYTSIIYSNLNNKSTKCHFSHRYMKF